MGINLSAFRRSSLAQVSYSSLLVYRLDTHKPSGFGVSDLGANILTRTYLNLERSVGKRRIPKHSPQIWQKLNGAPNGHLNCLSCFGGFAVIRPALAPQAQQAVLHRRPQNLKHGPQARLPTNPPNPKPQILGLFNPENTKPSIKAAGERSKPHPAVSPAVAGSAGGRPARRARALAPQPRQL